MDRIGEGIFCGRYGSFRVPKGVTLPLLFSMGTAAVVFLIRLGIRRKSRPIALFYLEAQAYEVVRILMDTRLSDTAKASVTTKDSTPSTISDSFDTEHVCVTLNWNLGDVIRVHASVFSEERLTPMALFEIYCGLSRNCHPDLHLVCDLWNCLVAVMEHHLTFQVVQNDATFSCDESQVEELLVLCSLLRKKYSIRHVLQRCKTDWESWERRPIVQDFPEQLFLQLSDSHHRGQSLWNGILSLTKLLYSSCSHWRVIGLTLAVMLSPDNMLEALFGLKSGINWGLLYTAEMSKILNNGLIDKVSFWNFIKSQLAGVSGHLASIAVASTGPVEVLFCLRDFVISYILMDIVFSLHMNAYLALSTCDYNSDKDGNLSRRVSRALWEASQSVMGELQSKIPQFLDITQSCVVALRYPVMALAMWIGTQWGNWVDALSESLYMESAYMKKMFLVFESSNKRNNNNDVPSSACPTHASPITLLMGTYHSDVHTTMQENTKNEAGMSLLNFPVLSSSEQYHNDIPQYGLVLLLTLVMERNFSAGKVWAPILRFVSWPANPYVFVAHALSSLDRFAPCTKIFGEELFEKVNWVKVLLRNLLGKKEVTPRGAFQLDSRYKRAYVQGFSAFRVNGVELEASQAALNDICKRPYGREKCYLRDVLRGFFRTADAAPLLLASTASLYAQKEYLDLNVVEQNDAMSHLQSVRHLYPLFPSLMGLFYEDEGFSESRFDVMYAQRELAFSGSSLGCYEVLDELRTHGQKMNTSLNDNLESLKGPFSVEFRDVWFRHSDTTPYILKGVSFFIREGEFWGIVGYSGSGKTTILCLMNRTYIPTSGDIFINNHNINSYPVRILRRRIANAWQEDGDMQFFDHLSIANNMALGNLWASDESDINRALDSAQALSFVQSRSSGIHSILHKHEFSGGELERLGIARALMRRSTSVSLYIFDEATNAVDALTEKKIFESIGLDKECPRLATFVVVSHRLSTLRHADKILVLSNGKVEQIGTWKDLSECEPESAFAKLLVSQRLPEYCYPTRETQ